MHGRSLCVGEHQLCNKIIKLNGDIIKTHVC